MLKLRTAAIAIAATASLVTATATTAEAASSVTIHSIKGKTIKKTAKTTIRPKVSHKAHVRVTSKTITVKKSGHTVVDHRTSARLKPGTYRVTTSVAFKVSRIVTKTRTRHVLRYESGASVPSDCTIASATPSGSGTDSLGLDCQSTEFPSDPYQSATTATDNLDGTWTVALNGSQQQLTAADGNALVGQQITGRVLSQSNVRELVKQRYKKREYGSVHHKSKSQTLRIKAKKPKAKHACTHTASGSCIAGGQFCPQAKYGKSGWDSSGRRYVCKGDHTHPHWEKP